jgi:hypothetical protein
MKLGRGLDVGTMNLVAAKETDTGIAFSRMRDAFLSVPKRAQKMMKMSNISYIEQDDNLLIFGDNALDMSIFMGKDFPLRRPLQDGLIAPGEIDSVDVLTFMLKEILGEPAQPNEICYFSVPASPIDVQRDVVYHEGIFTKIISQLGYEAISGNEAEAIVFSECVEDGFSGIGISFGSGMTNIALVLKAMNCMEFSLARGGDWIDKGASVSIGKTQAQITEMKEAGVDLLNPKTREEEAIVFYYKKLITYAIDGIAKQFMMSGNNFSANQELPIVLSGGTSKAINFVPFFKTVFERKRARFPIKVSDIRHAKDPLNSVAKGLLIQARQEYK